MTSMITLTSLKSKLKFPMNNRAFAQVCILILLMSVFAYFGGNATINLSLEYRISHLESLTEEMRVLTIEQVLNSSFYPMQKGCSYQVDKVGSYTTMQNGTTGKLDWYNTNSGAMINAVFGNLTSGRTWKETVVVKGDFTLTSAITLKSNLILDLSSARLYSTSNIFTLTSNIENCELVGGVIDGSPFPSLGGVYYDFENCTFRQTTYVKEFYWEGSLKDCKILGNTFRDGLILYTSGMEWLLRNKITDNTFIASENMYAGLQHGYFGKSKHDLIADNHFIYEAGFGDRGIVVEDDHNQTRIIGNHFDGWTKAILLTAGGSTYIRDTVIVDNTQNDCTAFYVVEALGTVTSTIIDNNSDYVTENSGTATNSTTTTFVFDHGLAGTPTGVWSSFNTTAITGWAWTATSTQITITVSGSGLPAIISTYWKAEYVP